MAIAEAEPKKSEVAVTSAGVSDGIKEKVLSGGKSFSKNKGFASSSSGNTDEAIKSYNLYDSIKGFRFEMPDGWNDEDIGLFVVCCWEKKDDLSKANVDKTKIWADIAQSGAKKSRNPSLFTINNCLELAERIRYYVSKNTSIFLNNEAFMKFHSDVKSLLPHFSDNFVKNQVTENKGNKKKMRNKSINELSSELLNSNSDLGVMIRDLTVENSVAIRKGDPNVWFEISNKLKERLGISTDAKVILESEKSKIISDVNKLEEKGINKKDAFIERAQGLIEVFDFIMPKDVKVSDYVAHTADSSMNMLTECNVKSVAKVRRLSNNRASSDESRRKSAENDEIGNSGQADESVHLRKIKKGRVQKNKTQKENKLQLENGLDDVSGSKEMMSEPTSTTSFDEVVEGPNDQEVEKLGVDEQLVSVIEPPELDSSCAKSSHRKVPSKSPRKWNKERPPPERILPARSARNKVTTYNLNSIYKPQSMGELGKQGAESLRMPKYKQYQPLLSKYNVKNSPNFRGFDSDSEDLIDKFQKLKGEKNSSKASPDTTTMDPDEKLVSKNSSNYSSTYSKRLNRKRKDNGSKKHEDSLKQEDSKVRRVHADSTMKNLVVKLVDCHGSMDFPALGNTYNLPKQLPKTTPFNNRMRPERSKETKLIEETVVMGKDVVDSVYNPSSDSAKLVSDEHLSSKGQRSGLVRESKRMVKSASAPLPATSLKDSNQFSKGLDFTSAVTLSNVIDNSRQITKHHVTPFYESSQHGPSEGSTSTSVDTVSSPAENKSRILNLTSFCTKLKENSVSPFNSALGEPSSGSLESSYQNPSTSNSTSSSPSNKTALETALATLKQCQKGKSEDGSLCITTNTNMVPSRFIPEIDSSRVPEWFGNFVTDFRKHEALKIQQLLKMQKELADVENRKISLLEKILGSLVDQ